MARLKPPASLEKIAFDVLLRCVIRCCDRMSANGSLDEFRQAISVIKMDVYARIPPLFLADFSSRFLDEFCSVERPAAFQRAALEIVMDIKVIGLKCKGPIVAYLDPQDGHRLQGLEELDLDCFPDTVPISLENFHLDDLTTFIFPRHCTDLDLAIIGQSCPKLQIAKIRDSKKVTDEGLRALYRCAELRVVDIVGCPEVSHSGINHMLSLHEKLEDFGFGNGGNVADTANWPHADNYEDCRFLNLDPTVQRTSMNRFFVNSVLVPDIDLSCIVGYGGNVVDTAHWSHADNYEDCGFLNLDPTVRRTSMNRFFVNSALVSDIDLSCIAKMFPNLTYLGVNDFYTESLSALTSLAHLTGLEFNFLEFYVLPSDFEDTNTRWLSLEQILPCIGVNITTLKFHSYHPDSHLKDYDLDLVVLNCPNIECLKFDFQTDSLVVLRFEKLKELTICYPVDSQTLLDYGEGDGIYRSYSVLVFRELLKLETLTFVGFQVSVKTVEAMMLDAIKFPNLSVIETNGLSNDELSQLERNARMKNIDFQIKNHCENRLKSLKILT